jgi:hypothetical protein
MSRALKAAALFLFLGVAVLNGVAAEGAFGEGGAVDQGKGRDISFFGGFGAEKNRNKFEGRLDCVYGDPIKGKMCPPVMNDPMAHLKDPEVVKEAGASSESTTSEEAIKTEEAATIEEADTSEEAAKSEDVATAEEADTSGEAATSASEEGTVKRLAGGIYRLIYGSDNESETKTAEADGESTLSIFSRCLDDPDALECRELQIGDVSPAHQVASAPGHGRNLFGATVSPTVDDCGGNMFDPRFCASVMPSASQAPSSEGDGGPPTTVVANTPEPTVCEDRIMSSFIKSEGNENCPVLFDESNLPIVLESTGMNSVSVKMINTFDTAGLGFLALAFPDEQGEESCVVMAVPNVAEESVTIEVFCDETGFVQLDVVAASPGFVGTQGAAVVPDTCIVPENPDPVRFLSVSSIFFVAEYRQILTCFLVSLCLFFSLLSCRLASTVWPSLAPATKSLPVVM